MNVVQTFDKNDSECFLRTTEKGMELRTDEEVSSSSAKKSDQSEPTAIATAIKIKAEEDNHPKHSPIRTVDQDSSEGKPKPKSKSKSRSRSISLSKSTSSSSVSSLDLHNKSISSSSESSDQSSDHRVKKGSKNHIRLHSKVEKVSRTSIKRSEPEKVSKSSNRTSHRRERDWDRREKEKDLEREKKKSSSGNRFSRFVRQKSEQPQRSSNSRNYYQERMARLKNHHGSRQSTQVDRVEDGSKMLGQIEVLRVRINRDRLNNQVEAERLAIDRRHLEEDKELLAQNQAKVEADLQKKIADVQKKIENADKEEKKQKETLAHCQWWNDQLKQKEAKLMQDTTKFEQRLTLFTERILKLEEQEEKLKKKHRMLIHDEARLVKEKETLLNFVANCGSKREEMIGFTQAPAFVSQETQGLTNVNVHQQQESKSKAEIVQEMDCMVSKFSKNDYTDMNTSPLQANCNSVNEQRTFENYGQGSCIGTTAIMTPMTTTNYSDRLYNTQDEESNNQLKIIEAVLGDLAGPAIKLAQTNCSGSGLTDMKSDRWVDQQMNEMSRHTNKHTAARTIQRVPILPPPPIPSPAPMPTSSQTHSQSRHDKTESRQVKVRLSGSSSRKVKLKENEKERRDRPRSNQKTLQRNKERVMEQVRRGGSAHGNTSRNSDGDSDSEFDQFQRQEWRVSRDRVYNNAGGNRSNSGDFCTKESSWQRRFECHRCQMILIGHENLTRHLNNMHRRPNQDYQGNCNNEWSSRRPYTTLIRRDGRRMS